MSETDETNRDDASPMPNEVKRSGFRGRRGNPQNCLKCGAKTRRGTPCQLPAEKNVVTGIRKRCRLHGARCPGPWKHGLRSFAYLQAKKAGAAALKALKQDSENPK